MIDATIEDATTRLGTSLLPNTMKAVTQHRYGDSSVLSVSAVSRPTIGPTEVLIEVEAAAVDRGTEHLMTGEPWLVRLAGYGIFRPKSAVIGLDVAGIVKAVGTEVTRFAVGDEVFGFARGSVAEYAAAEQDKISHKPTNVGFESAAAASVSGTSALQALTDVGRLESGQRVLVIGASGGVGTFAVQIARAEGAIVDGVAGTDNLDLVKKLGADVVYDYRTTDLREIDRPYDLILDIGGRNSVRSLRRLLTEQGTLVIVGGENGNRLTGGNGRQLRAVLLSPFVSQRLTTFISTEHHSFLGRLAAHLESGAVVPAIGQRYHLADTAEAMRQMAAGTSSGKTVILARRDPRPLDS